MKVGFDIDGVLGDMSGTLKKVVKRDFNVDVPKYASEFYIINAYSGLSDNEADDHFWNLVRSENLFAKIDPHEDFIALCNKCIDNDDVEVFVVTHRFYKKGTLDKEEMQGIIQSDTVKWLKEKLPNINPNNIHFTGGPKGEVVGQLGLDIYVDDRHDNAEDVADACKFSLLVNRDYNEHKKPEKSVRIYGAKYMEPFVVGLLGTRL